MSEGSTAEALTFSMSRLTEPPKSGVLKTEHEYWFEIKDQMIREHPHMQIGIVGRRVVAIEATHKEVYRKVLAECGNVPMVIERADDEDSFGDWPQDTISREAAITLVKAIKASDDAAES